MAQDKLDKALKNLTTQVVAIGMRLDKTATKDEIKKTRQDIRKVRKEIREFRGDVANYAVQTQGKIRRIEEHVGLSPVH